MTPSRRLAPAALAIPLLAGLAVTVGVTITLACPGSSP